MSDGDSKSKVWIDWAFRILAMGIIPLGGWIITMEVQIAELKGENALQNEKISRLETDVKDLNVKVKEIETNKLVLVKLETELQNANKTLSRIETAISNLGDD